ncbi:Hypothetical_protein [Hexamita inflata]|uniref:Hypothetical_protein n=1 Tax=Hexamita inflata TaxID=28002 RepID=A0AA86QR49_9EUKA|nr:Hypothetical protein HINF_LOCUS49152 [Hexamita inflata]
MNISNLQVEGKTNQPLNDIEILQNVIKQYNTELLQIKQQQLFEQQKFHQYNVLQQQDVYKLFQLINVYFNACYKRYTQQILQHIQNKNQELALKEQQIIESIIKYKSKTQQSSNSQQFEDESIQFSTQLTDTQLLTDQQNFLPNIQQEQKQNDILNQYCLQQQKYEELLQESAASEFKYAALLLELNNVYQYLNQFQDPDASQPSSWSTKVMFKENLHLKELQQQNVEYQKSVQQQLQIKDDHISQLKQQIAEIQKDSLSNLENYQKTVEAHQKLQATHESAVAQNEFLQNEMSILKNELCKYQKENLLQETMKHPEHQEKYIQCTEEIAILQQKITQQQVQAQKENEMLVKRIMQVKEQNLQLQTKIQQIESGKKPKKDNAASEPNNTKDIEELIQQSNVSKRYIEQLESQLYSSKNDLKKQIDTREQLLQTNLQLVNNNQNEMKQYKVEITELKNKLSVLNQQLSQYQKESQYKTEKLANEKIQIFVAKDIKLDIEQLLIKQQEMNQIVEVQIQQINSLQLLVQTLKQQLFITSIQELANNSQNVEEYKLISVNQ